MPDSQTSADTPTKSRLRGDMYLRAEQRARAEAAAAQLTDPRTPAVPGVYKPPQAEEPGGAPPSLEDAAGAPFTAAADAVEMWPTEQTLAVGPTIDPRAGSLSTTTTEATEPWPSESSVVPARPVVPVVPMTARVTATPPAIQRQRQHSTRSMAPVAVLSAIAIAGTLGIAAMLWPASEPVASPATQPPAVTRSSQAAAAPVATQPAPPAATPTASRPAPARPASAPASASAPAVEVVRRERPAVLPASRTSEGQLRVTSSPAGARVTVNGIGWGQTPVTVTNLPLGTKTVRVTHDGYASQQRIVDLRADRAIASLHVALPRAR